jgi:hypothetical protein
LQQWCASSTGVDFGPLRVVDDCVKHLTLKNTEKYDVKFSFAISSNLVKSLVTISPEDGSVPAGKEVAVKVSCWLVHSNWESQCHA